MDETILALSGMLIFVGIILYFKFKKNQERLNLEKKTNSKIIIK